MSTTTAKSEQHDPFASSVASNHYAEEGNHADQGDCDKKDSSFHVVGSLQPKVSGEIELSSLVGTDTSLFRDDDDTSHHHEHQSHQFAADTMGEETTKPSNEKLLLRAFVSFMSFALLEFFFAFLADSEAMKGDAAAMMVDAMTYLCNWSTEYKKHHFNKGKTSETNRTDDTAETQTLDQHNHMDPSNSLRLKKREYRKLVLQMDLLSPLLSVLTLLLVTIWISYQAIWSLSGTVFVAINGMHPNIHLMMGFSLVNLGLDGINVFGFAKAKHLFGYLTTSDDNHHHHHSTGVGPDFAKSPPAAAAAATRCPPHGYERIDVEGKAPPTTLGYRDTENPNDQDTNCSDDDDDEEHHANLNMCSAYTHVFADTLRSIAVIIASTIASVVPGVTAEAADATAALAVSILILLSLIPLLQGMIKSVAELRDIYAEENFERLLQQEGQEEVEDRGPTGRQ